MSIAEQSPSEEHRRNFDVAVYFLAKLAPAVLGFASVFFLTRALSPEGYGQYAVVITVTLVCLQVFGGWVTQAMFFHLPRQGQSENMEASFGKMTFLASIAGAGAIVIGLLLARVGAPVAVAGACVFAVQMYWNYYSTYFQSRERSLVQLNATLCQVGLQIIVLAVLYYTHHISVVSALFTLSAGFAAGVFLLYATSRKAGIDMAGVARIDMPHFWRHVRMAFHYGGPMCIWFVAVQLYTFSDRFLLKWAGLSVDLGRYSAVRDLLLGLMSMMAMPLLMAAHPMIMRMWSEQRPHGEIAGVIQRNLTIICAFGAFASVVLYDYGGVVFSVVLSERYQLPNVEYVLIGATIIVSVASMYAHKGLEVTGATSKMAALAAGVASFSGIANLLLIRRYGLPGVIAVGLLSQVIYFIAASWLSRRMWITLVPLRRLAFVMAAVMAIHFVGAGFDLVLPWRVMAHAAVTPGLVAEVVLSSVAVLSMREIRGIVRILSLSPALTRTTQ